MAEPSLKPLLLNAPAIEKLSNQLELMPQTALSIRSNVSAELVKLPDRRLIHRLLQLGAQCDDFLLHPEQFVVVIIAADSDVEGLREQAQKEHGKSAAQTPLKLCAGQPTEVGFQFVQSPK